MLTVLFLERSRFICSTQVSMTHNLAYNNGQVCIAMRLQARNQMKGLV